MDVIFTCLSKMKLAIPRPIPHQPSRHIPERKCRKHHPPLLRGLSLCVHTHNTSPTTRVGSALFAHANNTSLTIKGELRAQPRRRRSPAREGWCAPCYPHALYHHLAQQPEAPLMRLLLYIERPCNLSSAISRPITRWQHERTDQVAIANVGFCILRAL